MAVLFPMAFVDVIAEAMERNLNSTENEYRVFKRPLGPTDPSRSVAIFPDSWAADPADKLIGAANREPYQSVYRIAIQNNVVHGDTEVGRAMFSVDTKSIRAILYRDTTFHVALAAQAEEFMTSTERVIKYDVLRQEYMASQTTIGFLYLAKTDFAITTEITK